MAYLVKTDLHTHLYPEIIDEIIRKFVYEFAAQENFPEEGVIGYLYKDNSSGEGDDSLFAWTGTSYIVATDPDMIVTRAINAAIAEVKSYLSRYDVAAMFGETPIGDEHLKNITKDVACWQLIRLSNPNIDLKLFRTNYEDATNWLKMVQKGQADPEGWPYKEDDPETPGNENSGIQWTSNKKKSQHF